MHKTYDAAVLQTKGYKILRLNVIQVLAEFELTTSEWAIIGHIYKNGHLRLIDLAVLLDVEAPHVTSLIDKLDSKYLISKMDDPSDRRAKRLELTPKAQKLVPKIEQILSERMSELLKGLSEQDLTIYFKVLNTIILNGSKKEN